MTLPKESGRIVYLDRGGPAAVAGDFVNEFIHLNRDSYTRETVREGAWILAAVGSVASAAGSDALTQDHTGLVLGAGILSLRLVLDLFHRTKNGVVAAINGSLDRVDAKEKALRRGDTIYYS